MKSVSLRNQEFSFDSPALRDFPSKLFVETTSRCNLNCFMCVKQTDGGELAEGDLQEHIFDQLVPGFARLEALILNGIGEPLLHPGLEDFILRAKQHMPADGWVGFQSNAVLLSHSRAKSLVEAGLDKICLSVDGISPQVFREVREGGDITAVERAFRALIQARENNRRSRLQTGIEFVLMRDNLDELIPALRWAAKQRADFAIVTHMLPYDEKHAQKAAYDLVTAEALELFQNWQQKALSENLDLYDYYQVLWKFTKSAAEKRLISLVEKMKLEAETRGISLDLRSLLTRETPLFEETEAVFEKARQVASETGLDLRLPETRPRSHRRCDFVEDGGAFISWEGNVHPCYFLWHRYRCYSSGWDQLVRPRTFGNLSDKTVLEIWNAEEFRDFRENVLAYDHPFCTSCSVAPCDYVQTEDFEQDCHLKTEPCGSCLWCMGLFQCLR